MAALTTYATKLKKYLSIWKKTGPTYAAKHPATSKRTGRNAAALAEINHPYLTIPTSFVVGVVTDNSVALSWTAVTNATNYIVMKSTDAKFKNNVTQAYSGATASATVSSVVTGTKYYFKVYAQSSGTYVDSSFTVPVSATTISTLAAPASFATASVTATTLTLNWAAVTSATGYVVQRATNVGFSAGLTSVYTGALLTANDTGLTTATQYFYRVKATAANHNVATYASLNVTTS